MWAFVTACVDSTTRWLGFVVSMLALFALGACDTTIPPTDTTPPRVELRLTGPGGGTMSNPPRRIWIGDSRIDYDSPPGHMVIDWPYRFTLTVTDEGGVSTVRLELDNEIVDITSVDDSATVSNEVVGTTRVLQIRGSPDDPQTALILTGELRVPLADREDPAEITTRFRAFGSDFGGQSGISNETDLVVAAPFATGLRRVLFPLKTGAEMGFIGHDHEATDFICPIERYGLLSGYWERDYGIPVGYEHFWDNSPNRERCETGLSRTFLGLVKFDLTDMPDRPLRRAFLHFSEVDVNSESHPDNTEFCLQPDETGEIVERRSTGDVTRLVGPATREWSAGKRDVTEYSPLGVPVINHMPVTEGVAVTETSPFKKVEITDIVKRWLDGRLPNHGLALTGPDYDLYKKNKVCAATAIGFKLQLVFDYPG